HGRRWRSTRGARWQSPARQARCGGRPKRKDVVCETSRSRCRVNVVTAIPHPAHLGRDNELPHRGGGGSCSKSECVAHAMARARVFASGKAWSSATLVKLSSRPL